MYFGYKNYQTVVIFQEKKELHCIRREKILTCVNTKLYNMKCKENKGSHNDTCHKIVIVVNLETDSIRVTLVASKGESMLND